MQPVLIEIAGVSISSYSVFVGLAIVVAVFVRRVELRRLGTVRDPRSAFVSLGALVGALVGAKLGVFLFYPEAEAWAMLSDFSPTGKTIVGGLAGGYVGVEIAKRSVGIRESTGDGFALALPLSQAIGRLGCVLAGCCYGSATDAWPALQLHGEARHPAPLYEAALLLALALWLFAIRRRPRPPGHLFRYYLMGYAAIRFMLEPLRGDPSRTLGPLSAVQWVCLMAFFGFLAAVLRDRRAVSDTLEAT